MHLTRFLSFLWSLNYIEPNEIRLIAFSEYDATLGCQILRQAYEKLNRKSLKKFISKRLHLIRIRFHTVVDLFATAFAFLKMLKQASYYSVINSRLLFSTGLTRQRMMDTTFPIIHATPSH